MGYRDWQHRALAALRQAHEHRHPTRLRPYIEALAGVVLLWAVLSPLQLSTLAAPGSPYLLLVLAIALRWGLRVGLFASVLSVVVDHFQLTAIELTSAQLPYAFADLLVFTTVTFAVGLLASFYRGERLRAERAARHDRQAAEHQRHMVGILAHDLRTPLAAARGYTELAQRQEQRGQVDLSSASLTNALEQLDRATAMIGDLVEAGRIEHAALTLGAVPLHAALTGAIRGFTSDPLHALVVDIEPTSPLCVRADPTALARILDNLLSNAVKYSPEGGPITVSGHPLPAETDATGRVRIRIADRGIGVPEEDRERIFAPYYRGKNQRYAVGTGVGLYICRELARKMDATLGYAPNPDGGSIFQLDLVLAPARPAATLPPEGPTPPSTVTVAEKPPTSAAVGSG